ncbi:proline-rich protein Rad9 [Rhizoctonia solani AG-1 IA]|uniref:Sister chromatid cohesion protein n=1 Tax=Thanatephorus cucumeris (strain AG1-IA) TaxID=983506 RepID=L8WJU8_THACA|nr:proline-rich protein Rad9 [Rhizoctonia solani AG-1 IA]
MMHGQQHYQTDSEVRQYAARYAYIAVIRSAYHGYAPPTQWSRSQYTAPVESYSQYSHGGNYGHGQSTSIQQQYGYQQGSRPGFSVQSQTSQYQTLSSQTSHQVSQTHGYPSEIRAMPHPSMEQSTLDARANSKPYSQTYSAQQYGIDQSSTGSVSSGSNERHDVNRLQYQNHHGSNPRHRQASYPTSDAATYVNRPSYPSQSSAIMSYNHQGITSYSQPQSSTASYPSQPQPSSVSQSRTTQPDSYASAFLAPLASHQFAPRLSQSVSTLPRHSSDSRAVYSTNSRSVYSEGARPVYSADGRYLYSADAQGNPTTSQKPPSSSSQIPITQQPYSSQPLQRNSLSQQQTAFQTNTNPGRGHSEEAGSSNDTRVQTVYGYAPRSQSGKRHYQEQYEYHNQLQAPHSNQVKQDMHSDNHHVGNRQAHGTRRQPEGRWGTNSSELDTHNHSPGSFTHHSHQRPEQPDSATHYTASQGQPVQSLSTSQVPDEQLSEGTYAAQPHIQNNASHSAQNSDGPHTQPYSSYRYSEAHARSHVKPVSEHPPAHTIPVQQTNNVAPEQQPGVQTSQSSQAEMQTAQPTGLSTQTQTYHRDVYAPLAGRPLRGRGVGRPLYNGPPRVLQGGPQRILSIPQPTQLPQPHPRQQQGAYRPPVRRSSNASGRQVIRTPSFSPVYGEIQQLRSVPDPIPGGPNSNISSDTAQETPGTAEPSYTEASGDCSMEDANATARLPETGATNELQVIIQETTTSHPNTPPPPYEPLAKDRARLQSGSVPEQASGQGVNGYATQLQQLSLRSQQSTPQPPSERSQVTGIPQVTFQHTITRPQPARNQTLHKHSAEDSAAHFDAFLSAGASTSASQPKPNSTAPIAPIQETTGARRPTPPVRTPSASNASSTRPRLSPVVELTQRSSFITPRKDKQWREPIRDATTDTPKQLDASSPDSLSLSPMKRKRDPNVDVGSKTMKRMMSMSIQPPQTPGALGRTYDATMRTPGTSKMKLIVELPLRKPANGLSPEHSHIGTSAQKRDPHIEKLRSLIDDIIEAEDALDPEIAAESGNTNDWFSTKTSDWHAPLLAPSVMARLTQLAGRRGTRLSDVDSTNLTRILKLLGRSIVKGEDMDPFNSSIGTTAPGSAVKPKAKGKKKAKGSAEEDTEIEECKEDVELTEGDFERLGRALEVAKEAVIAADCVLAFLSTEKLPKQVRTMLSYIRGVVKSQLSSIIYPYVETSSDVHGTSDLAVQHRKLLGDIFQTLNAVLPRITALANHGISETMVIQAVFIGIGPFFVVEVVSERASKADKKNGNRIQVLDVLGGPTSMRGLRLTALGLVRALFAAYESQRPWIVEEILGSLIKLPDMKLKAGQFKLRDGATIHVVSALLFQLVQTSAHDVRTHAQKLARKRREAIADAKTTTFVEGGKVPLLDEHDREVRSGKNKNTKSTNEAEYRSIFDNLIQDILVVLNWPEWPAANLLMSIVCKFMLSSLEDVKSSSDTAAKNMALDHLGEIATRLRETHLTMQLPFETVVKPLEEIVANCDLKALDDLILAHSDVYAHLTKRSSDDQAYDSARELTAATWAQELASCLRQCDSILSKTEGENLEDMSDVNLPKLASKIKSALRAVWKENTTDMFDLGIDAEIKRVDDLAERFGGTQSLRNAFEPILSAIILALDAPAVFMRTKALRSLGLIVTKDSSILKQANVRRAIENHLMDSSPQVRDAAIDLIGKYLVLSPELVDDYYPQIANRIADTGLVVRKRVIKLLKNLYGLTDNHQRRVDICTKLVLRLFDEDDGIKDLAISTIEELWFCDIPESNSGKRVNSRETGTFTSRSMTGKISVIMGVNANFRDRHSPLEDMLHEIISRKNDRDSSAIVRQYVDVCDALTDSLVDAQEIPGFSVVNCIRTVHVFTAAHPTVMSTRKAVVLLPYLKNGSTGDDHAIADYLLKIFRSCIPRMPTGTSKFGTELQQTLEPMVIKPVGMAGVAPQPSPQDMATLTILAFIVSLLGEHSDFDKIRQEQSATKDSIDSIDNGPIAEYIYGLIHKLYKRFNDHLMTREDSAEMMDAVFASPQEEAQARLLKIMQEFLLSEASKHTQAAGTKEGECCGHGRTDWEYRWVRRLGVRLSLSKLKHRAHTFPRVSSAIIQRYLTQVLSSALSPNRHIQAPAADILSFTVRQGLAHPLQCFPIIVALETSHDNSLSSRASSLHTLLHNKHASLLNSRYLESVGKSLEYQKQLHPGTWKVQRHFSTDGIHSYEKRGKDQLDLVRYIAENMSAFDYKAQEEVLTVIRHLTHVLSVAGMHIVEILHQERRDKETVMEVDQPTETSATIDNLSRARVATVISIVLVLKAHLKHLYGITEEKASRFVPGKKTAAGDKPASARHDRPISWERVTFATRIGKTTGDVSIQEDQLLELWAEDGVTAEPDDFGD